VKQKKKRGQLTIFGLIITFILLVAFVALSPALEDVISDASFVSGTAEHSIINLFPFFILLAILASFVLYVSSRREVY